MANPDHPDDESEEARNERHRSAERRQWAFEKLGGSIALVFIAIAGGGAVASAIASFGAWNAANDAVRAALTANEINVRPYIKITLEPETFRMPISGAGFRGVKFKIGNTGRLPGMAYIRSAVDWQSQGHQRQEGQWPSIAHVLDIFLFPEQTSPDLSSDTLSITGDQLQDLSREPGRFFYVMVDILYGPKREFETRVCSTFILSGIDELRLSDGHPCTDKDSNFAK
jgi:hypothetical protein